MLYPRKVISPNPTGCQGWEFGIAPSGEAASLPVVPWNEVFKHCRVRDDRF